MRWILALAGIAAAVAGGVAIWGQVNSGAQPWTAELRDNVVLAQSVPLALGLGIALGVLPRIGRAAGLWALLLGLLLAVPTGLYQYLGGLLDHHPPFDLYLVYRVHYVGAGLLLLSVAALLTDAWMSGDRSFLVPPGRWRAYLRGAADEVPRPVARAVAVALRIDLSQPPPPPPPRYSFYELVVSLPWWYIGIALITVTGLIKALRYIYPVPGPVLFWSSTLHVAAMVILALKVLDQLRLWLAGAPGRVQAVAVALVALASLPVAYFFLWSAFFAKTAAKEGILSQVALLVGGIAIAVLALLLVRLCVRLIVPRSPA